MPERSKPPEPSPEVVPPQETFATTTHPQVQPPLETGAPVLEARYLSVGRKISLPWVAESRVVLVSADVIKEWG